ncbi:Uma2 family endonuclease [Aetokthonos hydrillicola Thurmond2011]|jgi:Uma2 family endonuclease|uniref:Uma2 family endonuclease n=1 Tax=Aetokthonos hydrillicola Thurmond2011 TaxID=2712845 RepID=A0AAP5IDS3_9CYAN|nr:Uma2 family endonuclease [Aetokthonos hydrillicola]MBO3463225.1 Uma2 family endonuclease [Aetokthonos hydrillicola CCALA 1050]MBW4590719.1 Uma2 family endonuclease [Aetokthonos hydrillicola CCALA 1050]MDR9899768.1 Uma2 family endonuclease [Aetokthonos hydrillicola Thurmond2011]
MPTVITQSLTLEEFLELPETRPASEYISGEILQKPMPKGKHSRLQLKLCNSINDVGEPLKSAYAFPELRCSFGTRSIVPDVAVFKWSRIPFPDDGEAPNDFLLCPDWTIEILSPEQSSNRVTGNILYCLDHGCQLGWLIDPEDRSILVLLPNQQPQLLQADQRLPVLAEIDLELTVAQVFSWLKMIN